MSHDKHTSVTDMATDSPSDTLRPSDPSGVSMDKPTLRQQLDKILPRLIFGDDYRNLNAVHVRKYDEAIATIEALIATAIREAMPGKLDMMSDTFDKLTSLSITEIYDSAITDYTASLTARLGIDITKEDLK